MSTFLQPPVCLIKYGDPVIGPDSLRAMIPLGTEEVHALIADLPRDERISIVRELHELRNSTRAERDFEDQVELNRERKRAKREGDRRDAEERDSYLSSTEGRLAAAQMFEADIIDLDDIEDPDPIIDGFLHRDTLVRTFGPPKSLKSFVTLDMAACVSLGIPWQGHRTEQTTVLYVVAEGLRGVKKRRNAWNEHHDDEMKVIFYPKAVQIGDQEQMFRLISFCRVKQIGYVVFDTQARCTVGVDENDNTENGEIVAALDILKRETGACVHLVHHSVGSNEAKARGATAWDGAVDAEFYTKRDKTTPSRVTLVTKFQKDIGEADDIELVALEVGVSLVLDRTTDSGSGPAGEVAPSLVDEPQAVYLEAIREMHGACARKDVIEILKTRGTPRSATAVKQNVNKLIACGALNEGGRGALTVTQAGLVYLDQRRKQGVRQGDQDTLGTP